MPLDNGGGKKKTQAAAVAEESSDLDGLDLDGLDFSQVGDPDASPDLPAADSSDPPWDDSTPDVPGADEDLDLGDLGLPATDDTSILAEYLPPLKASIDTLVGQVGDFHDFHKKRAESMQAAAKATADSVIGRIDDLEGKIHDLTALVRQLVQGTAPKEVVEGKAASTAEKKSGSTQQSGAGTASSASKSAGKEKAPPAAARPTLAEAQAKFKLTPSVEKALPVLNGMADGKELTLEQFKTWLQNKVQWTEKQAQNVIDFLKLKGPITNKTFS